MPQPTLKTMAKTRFDHIAFLVHNLEKAVNDYKDLLAVLDPDHSHDIVWDEGVVEGHKVRWATFVSPDGAPVLQFLESEIPRDKALLEKRGECVHHLAFCSTNVGETAQRLRDANIPLTSDKPYSPSDKPWLEWIFVHPRKAHGVLIEISKQYKVEDNHWVKD